jgi:Flp pilus assembly protein TadD
MQMKRMAAVIGWILGTLLVVSACGASPAPTVDTKEPPSTAGESSTSASLFERANEHANVGMSHLVAAAQYSQAGDQEAMQEEVRLANDEFGQAVTMFEELLAREPEHVSAMVNLGAVYYNLGDLDQAIAQYERALELEPDDAGIHSNLAAAHFQNGTLDQALSEYQQAVELDPTLAEAHFGLGVTYSEMGIDDKAIEAFERFQALDKGTDPIASQQAVLHLQRLRDKLP